MKVGTTSTIEQAAYTRCCSYSLQNTKSEVIAAAVCCGVASAVTDEHHAPVCKQVCVYRHLYDTFMQERRNTQMAHRKNAATLKKDEMFCRKVWKTSEIILFPYLIDGTDFWTKRQKVINIV